MCIRDRLCTPKWHPPAIKNSFISKTLNLASSIEEGEGLDLVSEVRNQDLDAVMNNSFGFGGTNVSLVFEKLKS